MTIYCWKGTIQLFIVQGLGRDKFFKTAEPEKMVERLLNLILTSNCPTVSIVEFELAAFAELNSDGSKSSILPLKVLTWPIRSTGNHHRFS